MDTILLQCALCDASLLVPSDPAWDPPGARAALCVCPNHRKTAHRDFTIVFADGAGQEIAPLAGAAAPEDARP